MPTGVYETKEVLITREMPNGNSLKISKCGPFFEAELNGIYIGKVVQLSTIVTAEGTGRGLRLHNHMILLSADEAAIIDESRSADIAKRQVGYEDKLIERETVKTKRKNEHLARFHEATHATPAMKELDRALLLQGTKHALPVNELNKIKAAASTDFMNRYFRGFVGELKYASGEITDLQEALDLTASIPLKLNR